MMEISLTTGGISCNQMGCIANVDGRCCVKKCRGAIIEIHRRCRTPEQAKTLYEISKDSFDYYFSENYEDEALEE